jgi:hypothetical protein
VPFVTTVKEEIRGKTFGEGGLGGDDQEGCRFPPEETSDEMGAARTGQTEDLAMFQAGTELAGDGLDGGVGDFVGRGIFVSHGVQICRSRTKRNQKVSRTKSRRF